VSFEKLLSASIHASWLGVETTEMTRRFFNGRRLRVGGISSANNTAKLAWQSCAIQQFALVFVRINLHIITLSKIHESVSVRQAQERKRNGDEISLNARLSNLKKDA